MLAILIYYVVAPILLGWVVLTLIQRLAPRDAPAHIARLFADRPIQPKLFRAVREEGEGEGRRAVLLGDFESMQDAVDAIYSARQEAREKTPGLKASFTVFNDRMEPVQQEDS